MRTNRLRAMRPAVHLQVGSIGEQSTLPPQLRTLLDLLAVDGELPTANITAAGSKTLAGMRRQVGGSLRRHLLGMADAWVPAGLDMWRGLHSLRTF